MKTLIVILSIIAIISATGYGSYKQHNFNADTNPVDTLVLKETLEGVKKYELDQNKENPLQLDFVKVLDCETKLVAGWKYKIKVQFKTIPAGNPAYYRLELYVIPWEQKVDINSIEKLEPSGAIEETDNNNIPEPSENEMLISCENKIRDTVNAILGDVINTRLISKQVVAGNNYVFQIDYQFQNQVKSFECTVWSRPWMNPPFEVTKVQDHEEEEEVETPAEEARGGLRDYDFDTENSEVSQLAFASLLNYLEKNYEGVDQSSVKVTSAQSQVVAGVNLLLDVEYSQNGVEKQAKTTIWVKVWEKSAKVTEFVEL